MPWTDLYVILSPDPCVEEDKTKASSPAISVNDALDVLWHDSHHAWDLKRIVIALFSLAIFIAGLFVHVPTRIMYSQSHAVLTTIATTGGDTVTENSPVKFSNVEAIPDILDWLNDTFVAAVFVTEDAFNAPLPENEWGRIAMSNQVLGGVSFEVTQMHKHECQTAQFLRSLYGKCSDSEQVTVYDFVMPFNYSAEEARTTLEGKGEWLNASTKELLITVPTLNNQIPGYVVTTLKFDFKRGGYIKPSFVTTPMLADHYPTTRTIVLDILIVLWFSPWMLIFTIVGYTMKRYKNTRTAVFDKTSQDGIMKMLHKCIFPDGWLAVDVLRGPMVHAFYVVVVFTQLKMTDRNFQQEIISLQEGSSSGYEALKSMIDSFKYIARLSVLMRLLATAAVFFQGLRVLNTFRNHIGLSLLSRSIQKAICWCGAFAVTFSVIFMAFAVSGAVLFGSHVHEFSSLLISMTTCVNMLFGEFDFEVISDVHYSVAFYWSFMVLETFVLLNIVLAIVIDAYTVERVKKERTKWWRCRRVVVNLIRGILSNMIDLLPHRLSPAMKEHRQVVLWGRIRSKTLRQVLRVKLENSQDLQHPWTPDTILTVETMELLFPEATEIECVNTITYLVAGICHDANKHENRDDAVPTDNNKLNSEIQTLTIRLDGIEEKMEQLNLILQQKIDLLVEKIGKL
ncbi:hypothetical protein PHMEG_00010752 [Phytophthora megakarya]|uniref:Polycystin cation channel PKD1/PKD2 domain-containing protein n=1 Tax=Phytophthora megakarya TaxID=4795 RepID=A0A225WD79_9STRA|nr:hypothetical protein PHMEG_00010752 [Phytophthora megakarya]